MSGAFARNALRAAFLPHCGREGAEVAATTANPHASELFGNLFNFKANASRFRGLFRDACGVARGATRAGASAMTIAMARSSV